MAERKIILTHVYITRGVVSGWVSISENYAHRIGHLPSEGWFCTCPRGKRCRQIEHVKALVPVEAIELGARAVREGTVSGGVCTPAPH